jgi:LmbE family N-acetylglucosaminyl deacetylase
MTTLVISPHLDDAVLSLPAWLASAAGRGEQVVVLTVFTEGDADYPMRRAEDLAALASIGVGAVHLGLRDAPERRGLARSFRALVLGELDDADVAEVHRVLSASISRLAPTTVLLPLGVGEHVDHRVVHAIHTHLPGRVGFYEDRPYSLVRHAVRARLTNIGAVVEDAPEAMPPAQAAAEFCESARAAAHVRALVPPAEREDCLAPFVAMLTGPPGPVHLHLRREVLEFRDPGILASARAAVQAYASQLAALFGGEDALAHLFADSPYSECIHWRR